MLHKKEFIYSLVFWIAFWQLSSLLIGYDILLPSPLSVVGVLFELIVIPNFWLAILGSISKVISAFILASIVGTFFAFFSIKYRLFYVLFDPIITLFKAVPVASFIILLLVWFSSSTLPIGVCFMMVLPVFYTNMRTAFLTINPKLIEMSRVFNLSPTVFIRHIVLPEITPLFLSTVKLSIGLAFKSGIACEIISLSSGTIGEQLYHAKIFLDTPTVFSWTLIIILLSILLEKGFILFINWCLTKLCEVHL